MRSSMKTQPTAMLSAGRHGKMYNQERPATREDAGTADHSLATFWSAWKFLACGPVKLLHSNHFCNVTCVRHRGVLLGVQWQAGHAMMYLPVLDGQREPCQEQPAAVHDGTTAKCSQTILPSASRHAAWNALDVYHRRHDERLLGRMISHDFAYHGCWQLLLPLIPLA